MNEIRGKAWAKLNISLDVLGRREDGFHNMAMVMQTVSLADEITITPAPADSGIRAVSDLSFIPGDERNLAVKAANTFFRETGLPRESMIIRIRKKIPVGAGLAGGSADAAAVLRMLNREFGAPLDTKALLAAAEKTGSDVAFCTIGGTVLAEGRGEILTILPPMPSCFYVIAMPGFSISTPELFRKLDGKRIRCHPDTSGLVRAVREGDISGICRRMYNVFEDVDDRRMRTVAGIRGRLTDCGAMGAIMTGTGSAVFGIFADRMPAENAAAELGKECRFTAVCENVGSLL